MKTYLLRSLVALIVFAFATVSAFADKRVQLTFANDVMVNGTLVKAGDYDFRFDEEAGELAILKNGKVRVKTSAKLETRSDKARYTGLHTRKAGDVEELIGVSFKGSTEHVVVTSAAAQR